MMENANIDRYQQVKPMEKSRDEGDGPWPWSFIQRRWEPIGRKGWSEEGAATGGMAHQSGTWAHPPCTDEAASPSRWDDGCRRGPGDFG